MSNFRVIGIDLGKSTFHLIAHDYAGREVLRKKLTRPRLIQFLSIQEPTIIAMEACGGCHWLARKCESYGHQVKLIPAQYVKPYVKTHKNDFIDADAIAEAAMRPSMRFTSPKSETAQVVTVIRRIRSGYIKERTASMNRIGSMLLEFGMSFPRGHAHMKKLFQWLADKGEPIPLTLMVEVQELHEYYKHLNELIKKQDKKLQLLLNENPLMQLLQSIPGVGPMTAACCLSNVGNASDFKNGRNFAAWIGLVPFQYSTGGKTRMLGISKRGNKELRELFVDAARVIVSRPETSERYFGHWLTELRMRKPFNVAVVALANKLARIAWSVMTSQKAFELRV